MTTLYKANAQAASSAMPKMPTREEYRHGINKMRAELNCPVLRIEEEDIGQELRDFDWNAQPKSHAPSMPKRPSVDGYLKKQYQENMIARYPEFERRTDCDIAQLKRSIDQMYSISAIIVMLLLLVLFIGLYVALSLIV